jgi:hypothetical protein
MRQNTTKLEEFAVSRTVRNLNGGRNDLHQDAEFGVIHQLQRCSVIFLAIFEY